MIKKIKSKYPSTPTYRIFRDNELHKSIGHALQTVMLINRRKDNVLRNS